MYHMCATPLAVFDESLNHADFLSWSVGVINKGFMVIYYFTRVLF